MLKESTPIHCVFTESKINIELGEGGSEINLLQRFPKIAKRPNKFGQDAVSSLIFSYLISLLKRNFKTLRKALFIDKDNGFGEK